jgi:hypothetical protein
MEKRYARVQDDFAGTSDSTSARASTLGKRGRRGPARHAIDQPRQGKKQRRDQERVRATHQDVTNDCPVEQERNMIKTQSGPGWSTSSLESAPDQTPAELAALATQLGNCESSRGRFFRIQSAVDTADGLARARFVTTIVLFVVAVAVTSLFF